MEAFFSTSTIDRKLENSPLDVFSGEDMDMAISDIRSLVDMSDEGYSN